MKCPYCDQEMEKGLIQSTEPINFMKKVRAVNRPKNNLGEFNLAIPRMGGRCHVDLWLCRDCRKMIIEY